MFVDNTEYVIHQADQPCGLSQEQNLSETTKHQVLDFIHLMYPKQKFLTLVFNPIIHHNLLTNDLYFNDFPNVHVADFCTFLNNRFCKKDISAKFVKLSKYLRGKGLRFPKVSIKNPMAQKLLC